MKFLQEYGDEGNILLDDLKEIEVKGPVVQAMFKRSRHNNLSIFIIINQDCYELPKRTIRANGNIYHTFKLNNFGVVQNLYQDKVSRYMTLKEFKLLISTCWNEKYHSFIDMTKDRYQGRYRLRLNTIFVPNSSSF